MREPAECLRSIYVARSLLNLVGNLFKCSQPASQSEKQFMDWTSEIFLKNKTSIRRERNHNKASSLRDFFIVVEYFSHGWTSASACHLKTLKRIGADFYEAIIYSEHHNVNLMIQSRARCTWWLAGKAMRDATSDNCTWNCNQRLSLVISWLHASLLRPEMILTKRS